MQDRRDGVAMSAAEWFSLDDAVELIRGARKSSKGAAIKFLISVCADGSVRSRQRACYDPSSWFGIPAPVWRDAHLDLDTGELYPAGTDLYDPPTEFGGYGFGGNGIIEVNEADLRYRLREPAPLQEARELVP